jgi:hypothetical protein
MVRPIMKSISASIIVLAGAILLLGGSQIRGETGGFIMLAGCVVGLIGLGGWFVSLRVTDGEPTIPR